jgi:hypothetical protein
MPEKGKGKPADLSGKVVGVSGNGKVLTVQPSPMKGEGAAKTEIKLTDATKESYHGVAADGARPAEGHSVQVWLAEGSRDTADRVRFSRDDPRTRVDATIVAVSADGSQFTVAVPTGGKGSEPAKREIKTTAKTTLLFFNVGLGGAKLTAGYQVQGWLVEGSEDTAEELLAFGSAKSAGKDAGGQAPDKGKPSDKKPVDEKPSEKKPQADK